MEEQNTPHTIPPQTSHSASGVVIGILIVILVLLLGGLYLWGSTLSTSDIDVSVPAIHEENESDALERGTDIQALESTSSSDELPAIEADLESTDLSTLDAELTIIENELGE